MQKIACIVIIAFAVSVLSACNVLFHQTGSEKAYSISLGTVTPDSFASIPDWTMDLVRSCYAEGLRVNPNQEGKIVFAVQPPEQTGPVKSEIISSVGLNPRLVECIRSSFGSIHHYVESGNLQKPVTDTLLFSRKVEEVCEPPAKKAIKRILSDRYDRYGVVELSSVDVVNLRHRVSEYEDDLLLRYVELNVELTFERDGYEGLCFHISEYKMFSPDPIEAEGAGHVCESIRRYRGDRVKDTDIVVFELDKGQWWEAYEEKAYCGDRKKRFSSRY